MSNCNDIAEVLKRNGLDQSMRYDSSLDPDNLKLMGFGLEDWMKFAYNFAKDVNFFDESSDMPHGDWQSLFPDASSIQSILDNLEKDNKLTPHLTLFVCFLLLIEKSTKRLNGFTKRHLDFYYSEVLHLRHLKEKPDSVNVVFELARAFAQEKIAAGTELDGGKDSSNNTRVYQLDDEIVLNHAKIAHVKTVYNAPDSPIKNSYALKAADQASTYDGNGAEFPTDETSWYPFGYAGTPDSRPNLADARIGFAIASHTLELSEGLRQIVFQAQFSDTPSLTAASDTTAISVYYTGEKGWVGPIQISPDTITIDENSGAIQTYQTTLNDQLMTLCLKLQPKQEAVVKYNASVHGGNYTTEHPVFRFEVATDKLGEYDIYRFFSRQITKILVKVKVSEMKALTISNDTGNLTPNKPFYPFTTNPVKGSAFSVFHPEIFSKKWKKLKVSLHWKNTPDSFKEYYDGYDKKFLGNISQQSFNSIIPITTNASKTYEGILPTQSSKKYTIEYDGIVSSEYYFKATSWLYSNGNWNNPKPVTLFVKERINVDEFDAPEFKVITGKAPKNPIAYETIFSILNNQFPANTSGPARLTLDQSFLQELYPRIYSLAMMSTNPNTPIPNQPYIPFADAISVSYSATDELDLTIGSESNFKNRTVQLFHVHPFGEAEENPYLKQSFDNQSAICTLTPEYCKGGNLFIGLENAQALQQMSLLIQVLEGSENPLSDSFEGSQKVHWSILCNNNWMPLDSTLMLVNETDNFLQSGLVKFKIPVQANSDNTLLPPGFFWIRAKMYKTYDSVCRILGIFSQAATATFDDRGNELSHLEKGLPAETISKLVSRIATIKSVSQPYNSFGGRTAETDMQFYKRISERLRHKQRAINAWDYEHLVLQHFPEIYKIKCLMHTCECSFQSPGNVTLVVIPDTLHRNVFDPYQPRVSKATLNRVDQFISELNSLHVKTHVINPVYDEVKVSLKVKFHPQFDEALYMEQLNTDMTQFLSPWTFTNRALIHFGGTLHLSVLTDFVEELPYVDYLQDVSFTLNGIPCTTAEPSSPKAILTSAKRHDISTAIHSCITPNTATEQCQL